MHGAGPCTLVLLRHGSSEANEAGRFGGWDDVPLTPRGVQQAVGAGCWLAQRGIGFDLAFSSVLDRAVVTAWHCLDALGQTWLPLHKDWRLNERHYGALQGESKRDMVERHGAETVRAWRRGYRARPPALALGDARDAIADPRYRELAREDVPRSESLHDTARRVQACWRQRILPAVLEGRNTLVVAHGNSIRALLMLLDGIGEEDIQGVEVPNGQPLVYRSDPASSTLRRLPKIV